MSSLRAVSGTLGNYHFPYQGSCRTAGPVTVNSVVVVCLLSALMGKGHQIQTGLTDSLGCREKTLPPQAISHPSQVRDDRETFRSSRGILSLVGGPESR